MTNWNAYRVEVDGVLTIFVECEHFIVWLEHCTFAVPPEYDEDFRTICNREKIFYAKVGYVDGDQFYPPCTDPTCGHPVRTKKEE